MRKSIFLFVFLLLIQPLGLSARTPNDPLISEQWHLGKVAAFGAWDDSIGSKTVTVAVLDTGIDLDHPDLKANIWVNQDEIPGDGIDNDLNGFIDDVNGWDFLDDDNDPEPKFAQESDFHAGSHGTIIAGTIGAVGNNGKGIAGINWDVEIMPVRILGADGSGDSVSARRAIGYAVMNGADVINLSFTGWDYDQGFRDAIAAAYNDGVVVVAAVGNDDNGGDDVDNKPIYPACFKSDDGKTDLVIGVSATDRDDKKAVFANYGANCTDISAPGLDIFSTVYEGGIYDSVYDSGFDGTSIAAPMVTGAVALLKARYPSLTPLQIKTILQLSVDALQERDTKAAGKMGAGRLNIDRAMTIADGFAKAVVPVQPAPIPTPVVSPVPVPMPVPVVVPIVSQDGYTVIAPEKGEPLVQVYSAGGDLLHSFLAYAEGFHGGVRVALGDVDKDGQPEIITGAGPGGGPHVRIFELDGSLVGQFFAYEKDLRSGVFVASGDVDMDGVDEIAVSTDANGGGRVGVFELDGSSRLALQPFGDTKIGIRVALGNLDATMNDELIVTLDKGGAPTVKTYDIAGEMTGVFLAYAPGFLGGVFASVEDVDRDGVGEIVTGTGNGGGPHVRVFEADGTVRNQFFAYDSGFRGGVKVSVTQQGTIVTAAGPRGSSDIKLYNESGGVLSTFVAERDLTGFNISAW